jgi:hypothetical protein
MVTFSLVGTDTTVQCNGDKEDDVFGPVMSDAQYLLFRPFPRLKEA